MWGVVPVEKHKFLPALRNPSELQTTSAMATAMATCHSLTLIEGKLSGDPLDVKMFEATGWVSVDRLHKHRQWRRASGVCCCRSWRSLARTRASTTSSCPPSSAHALPTSSAAPKPWTRLRCDVMLLFSCDVMH